MSLANLVNHGTTFEEVDPGYISDGAMEQLMIAIAVENLNPEEFEQYATEAVGVDIVTEAQKNIVKLNKQAQLNRAYKTGVLQCAAEDNRKEYKKLRTLWKLEAKIFQKLEKQYKNKAMAKAKEAMKNLKRKKSDMGQVAGSRASQIMRGASNLLQSGPVQIGKKK